MDRVRTDLNYDSAHFSGLLPENSIMGHNTLAREEMAILRTRILDKMVAKNKKLLAQLFKRGTDIVYNIAAVDWETRFVPLQYTHVEKIWSKLLAGSVVTNSGNLLYYVLHLSDQNWLCVDGVRDSRPYNIYPFSMSQIAKHLLDKDSQPSLQQEVFRAVRGGINAGQNILLNPRPAAAGTYVGIAAGFCIVM